MSHEDVYHEKALDCLLTILIKIERSVNAVKQQRKAHQKLEKEARQYIKKTPDLITKASKETQKVDLMISWIKETKQYITRLLNVEEQRVSEAYWQTLLQHCESPEFVQLLIKLKPQNAMGKSTEIFLQSESIQTSVSGIILNIIQTGD